VGGSTRTIVGRDDELRTIADGIDAAVAGTGRALFLVGESGIGKTRLAGAATELGYAAGLRLLRGRASAIGPTVPFRPLTEALLSLLRSGAEIDVDALGPYRPVLARLVPDLAPAAPVTSGDTSLVVMAEAVLRLISLAGRGHGCLLVLDDLQDADAETLAIVEYLIDNLEREPVLLLCAIRDEPSPALHLAQDAGRRGGRLVQLSRLGLPATRQLAGGRLGVDPAEVPVRVAELLWAGSAGNPLHIEELIAGMADDGFLVSDADRWKVAERPPTTFTRCVARRFERLDEQSRSLLSVAAVFGHRFPLTVVQAVTGLDYRDLLSRLHGDVAGQLVTPDDQTPDWYAFRHGLVAEALLNLLDPDERVDLARRAADAVEAAYPGLPGPWCQSCAALRLAARQPEAAGRLFTEAGRRALAEGAVHSAVAVLDRAWELLATELPERIEALETQVHALAEAGMVDRALAAADRLAGMGAAVDPHRRARVHTRLAWVANVDGRTAEGLRQLETARMLLGEDAPAEDTVPLDVVAAYLQVDTPGQHNLSVAEAMARRAATAAEQIPLPVAACQAWQLLGALARTRDPDEATAFLERSRAIAAQHDLPIWETHALVRLGWDDALRTGGLDRIEQARRQASSLGAVTARYQAEVNLTLQLILRGDFGAAQELIDQVLAATTRLKLVEITQLMLVLRTVLAGHRGRRPELVAAVAELHAWQGDVAQYEPRILGLAKAFCALLEEDRPLATHELAEALRADEKNPTTFPLSGRYGLDLLLSALSGELDEVRFAAVTSAPASKFRWDRVFASFARAVLSGRDGRADEAVRAVDEALRAAAPYPLARNLGLRLTAEAALDGGWGTPAEWLSGAEQYFRGAAIPAVADACRTLLRRRTHVPPGVKAAGITAREYEILRLLGQRLRNREIAEHLHVSQRTVETHVSSLLAKTGLPNRIELSKYAAGE
jgi:DNA-binding NarL/FixJ family response regulator